jgi:hypothetical protein
MFFEVKGAGDSEVIVQLLDVHSRHQV